MLPTTQTSQRNTIFLITVMKHSRLSDLTPEIQKHISVGGRIASYCCYFSSSLMPIEAMQARSPPCDLVPSTSVDLHMWVNDPPVSGRPEQGGNGGWEVQSTPLKLHFSAMTERSWHTNNGGICGTVISNMQIWHFPARENEKIQRGKSAANR